MCLGTVILAPCGAGAEQKLTDVVEVEITDGLTRVRTLFDETHDLQGVALRRIDLTRGVTITLARKEATP